MADNHLRELSTALADAAGRAGRSTVLVDGRDGYPASGLIYKPGFVLTAEHVVERDQDVRVVLGDGSERAGAVAGRDPGRDLAVVRLPDAVGTPLEPAPAPPRVGELVLALGRPTDEGIQASLGVVGITGGRYQGWHGGSVDGVMRTDAARFPGFSGGPLVDVEGRVVGINTFGPRFGSSLTIPLAAALESAARLEQGGGGRRGYLGVRSHAVEVPESVALGRRQESGLIVLAIEKGSPAEQGGLMVGDLIVGLAGEPVADHRALVARLDTGLADKPVEVEVVRAGRVERIMVTPGAAPRSAARRR
jgi:S1-C subfamily serine protease